MSAAENIEQLIKNSRYMTTPADDERILADAEAALERSRTITLGANRSGVWRRMMKSRYAKIGAAAAAAVAATIVLFPVFSGTSAAKAYAIEQTMEANRSVRAIHVKIDPGGDGAAEVWAEFDPNGQVVRIRNDFGRREGHKIVLWQNGKALVWFKDHKGAAILPEKDLLKLLRPDERLLYDPKAFVEFLYRRLARGEVKLVTQEPAGSNECIVLTTTSLKAHEGWREVYKVDPKTKLLRRFDKYLSKDGKDVLTSSIQYLEYNEAVDPNAFNVKVPDDVDLVDQTTADLGLPKGELSNEQVASRIAREFFEALIAKDYGKAGKLSGGFSAQAAKRLLEDIQCVRIVSIGQPTPHPNPKTEFLCVPCEVEVTANGGKQIKKYTLNIRHLYNRPDRWAIGGGDVFKKS